MIGILKSRDGTDDQVVFRSGNRIDPVTVQTWVTGDHPDKYLSSTSRRTKLSLEALFLLCLGHRPWHVEGLWREVAIFFPAKADGCTAFGTSRRALLIDGTRQCHKPNLGLTSTLQNHLFTPQCGSDQLR